MGLPSGMNITSIEAFREHLHNEKRSAWHAFPMRHYYGMISVEIIESTSEKEGGYKVFNVSTGGTPLRSIDTFYPFSKWEDFEMDILRKMHPQFICACNRATECFTADCPIKPV